jgi:hypothetical protein
MTGRASLATGAIFAPAETTRRQLYVLAHECGHIALHSALKSRRKPRHVEEHEAESYAHRALAAHGFEVPDVSTFGARCYVGECIEEDRANGIPICPLAEAFAMGQRSPYASLPSVDAFQRPKESGPERTCACRCALDQADMYSTSSTLDNSARAAA